MISHIRILFGADNHSNSLEELIETLNAIPNGKRKSLVGTIWPIIHKESAKNEHSGEEKTKNCGYIIINAYKAIEDLRIRGIKTMSAHNKAIEELYENGSLSVNPNTSEQVDSEDDSEYFRDTDDNDE